MHDLKLKEKEYELVTLTQQHIQTLYDWNIEEKHLQYYTCRPLKQSHSFEEYTCNIINSISDGKVKIYVLVKCGEYNTLLGKISLFDHNPRNHSAEFGYYLPDYNRSKGLGGILLNKFIGMSFENDELNLNKIYATTSSNNYPSISLLERYGFKLEGRLREHYWIDEKRYDQLIYSILKSEFKSIIQC